MLSTTDFIDAVRTNLIPRIITCELNEERIDQDQNGGISYVAYPMNPNPAHEMKAFEADVHGVDGVMKKGEILWGSYHFDIRTNESGFVAFGTKDCRAMVMKSEFPTLGALLDQVAIELQNE
jgi:hypothetical protein